MNEPKPNPFSRRGTLHRHGRLLRWVVAVVMVALTGFWVGANAPVAPLPLMCKIYG